MKIRMELISDAIFGNGESIPGAEDISVLRDENGFPYYKGGTFKGLLREEYTRFLEWTNVSDEEKKNEITRLFGNVGDGDLSQQLVFSDFVLSPYVKQQMLQEIGENSPERIIDVLTNIRTFTSITEQGVAKQGSLRMARCVDRGLCFYSTVKCCEKDQARLKEVIESVKWIGSMRNRGFGKVRFVVEEDA